MPIAPSGPAAASACSIWRSDAVGCCAGVAFAAVEQARLARREELKVAAQRRGRRATAADALGAGDPLRPVHRHDRAGAPRAARGGVGAGQPHHAPGPGDAGWAGHRPRADCREAGNARLSRDRRRARRSGRPGVLRATATAPRDGGGRLRRQQRDAAVRRRVVRRRSELARDVLLFLRRDRLAGGGLCRPAVLRLGCCRLARRAAQHGCADLARGAADAGPQPVRGRSAAASTSSSTRRLPCCSSCSSAATSTR